MSDCFHITGNILWAVSPISDSSPDDLLDLLEQKDWYLPFLRKITTEHRKKEWLCIRVLLKQMLGEEKEIRYTDSGRPYLTDRSYHISISHTRGYVAVALHKEFPVGIDLEYLSPRIKKIRNRFMHETEEMNISEMQEEIHLLLHWSAKESLFKALEESEVDFKNQLHIDSFEPVTGILSSFRAKETKTEKMKDFVINYEVHPGYVVTFTVKE